MTRSSRETYAKPACRKTLLLRTKSNASTNGTFHTSAHRTFKTLLLCFNYHCKDQETRAIDSKRTPKLTYSLSSWEAAPVATRVEALQSIPSIAETGITTDDLQHNTLKKVWRASQVGCLIHKLPKIKEVWEAKLVLLSDRELNYRHLACGCLRSYCDGWIFLSLNGWNRIHETTPLIDWNVKQVRRLRLAYLLHWNTACIADFFSEIIFFNLC